MTAEFLDAPETGSTIETLGGVLSKVRFATIEVSDLLPARSIPKIDKS